MIPESWRTSPSGVSSTAPAIDWPQWIRDTERKRRLIAAQTNGVSCCFWSTYYALATDASFRLDGLELPREHLESALARGAARKAIRSRQQQRVRNHVGILRHLERLLSTGGPLKGDDVLRWYTSIACGLSTTRPDESATARLDAIVRQINSPHMRLCPALQAIARLHREMLTDPIVPSFNGILARLLLRYHLGRCGLPPVVFDAQRDAVIVHNEQRLLPRLLELINTAYASLLKDD